VSGEREVARITLPLSILALAQIGDVLREAHGEGLAFRSIDSTTVVFVVLDGES